MMAHVVEHHIPATDAVRLIKAAETANRIGELLQALAAWVAHKLRVALASGLDVLRGLTLPRGLLSISRKQHGESFYARRAHARPSKPRDVLMNRRVMARTVCGCLAWCAFATVAHAAGDFVILGEGNAFWTNNLDAPVCKELVKLQKEQHVSQRRLHAHGRLGRAVGRQRLLHQQRQPARLQEAHANCKRERTPSSAPRFAPAGGWTVLWNQNGNWTEGSIPDEAFKKMQEVVKGGGTLRSIAFGPNGAWVVLFDKTGIWCGNIPDDLGKVFDNAIKKGLTVRCVCFTTTGTWICLTNNGWWTSDSESSGVEDDRGADTASISRSTGSPSRRRSVRTISTNGPAIIHQQCDGKLPGGYAFEVLHKGKVVAKGAEGWARAPWEPDHPSVKWTLDKPMGVASVSKTITAVALLKLWEETDQKFSLDEAFWPHIKAICPEASARRQESDDPAVAPAQERLQENATTTPTPRTWKSC